MRRKRHPCSSTRVNGQAAARSTRPFRTWDIPARNKRTPPLRMHRESVSCGSAAALRSSTSMPGKNSTPGTVRTCSERNCRQPRLLYVTGGGRERTIVEASSRVVKAVYRREVLPSEAVCTFEIDMEPGTDGWFSPGRQPSHRRNGETYPSMNPVDSITKIALFIPTLETAAPSASRCSWLTALRSADTRLMSFWCRPKAISSPIWATMFRSSTSRRHVPCAPFRDWHPTSERNARPWLSRPWTT